MMMDDDDDDDDDDEGIIHCNLSRTPLVIVSKTMGNYVFVFKCASSFYDDDADDDYDYDYDDDDGGG